MKFVADENVDPRIIARLRLDGHYIYSIYESNRGLKNGEVLALAEALLRLAMDPSHISLRCFRKILAAIYLASKYLRCSQTLEIC